LCREGWFAYSGPFDRWSRRGSTALYEDPGCHKTNAACGDSYSAVRYLARYVQHTAISDSRILHADDQSVRFSYTDSSTGKHCELTLTAAEFLRRYLQHILPSGRHRVRYFGWMHPSAKKRRALVETLLEAVIVVRSKADMPPALAPALPALRTLHPGAYRHTRPRSAPPPMTSAERIYGAPMLQAIALSGGTDIMLAHFATAPRATLCAAGHCLARARQNSENRVLCRPGNPYGGALLWDIWAHSAAQAGNRSRNPAPCRGRH
jgi:hypothetical protein